MRAKSTLPIPRPTQTGYLRVFRPGHPLAARDGYVLEHRLVVYEAGIPIPPGHHVHHLNGDKMDNRLENLVVLPASAHHRDHRQPGAPVVNQFGRFVVGSEEDRRELRNAASRASKARNRDEINARRWDRRARVGPTGRSCPIAYCAVCGRVFKPDHDQRCCSRVCAWERRRRP